MQGNIMLFVLALLVLGIAGFLLKLLFDLRRESEALRKKQSATRNRFTERLTEVSGAVDQTLTRYNAWKGTRLMRITSIEDEAEGIRTIELAPYDGNPLAGYAPGQYLTLNVTLPNGLKMLRCYSLSGAWVEGMQTYRISVKRVTYQDPKGETRVGRVSGFLHDNLRRNDSVDGISPNCGVMVCKSNQCNNNRCENEPLEVLAPSGEFVLHRSNAKPRVFLAGGIGITPLLAMWESLVNKPDNQETWLFYAVRSGEELLKADYLRSSAKARPHMHLRLIISRPDESRYVLGEDYQHKGRLDLAYLGQTLGDLKPFDYYMCGPPAMIRSLGDGLVESGVDRASIYHEAFVAEALSATTQSVFTVEFRRSGKTAKWYQARGTLLELAEAEDISIDFSCRMGQCGTCRTRILSGRVRHLANISSQLGSGECLPCIAVPDGNLELDA